MSYLGKIASWAVWGRIQGLLSDQTDLQDALDEKVDKAGDSMTGDLVFDGEGLRIKGDFSNLDFNKLTAFQTSVPNAHTQICILPSGASEPTSLALLDQPTFSDTVAGGIANGDGIDVFSSQVGAASSKPIRFLVDGSEISRITPNGFFLMGTTSGLNFGTTTSPGWQYSPTGMAISRDSGPPVNLQRAGSNGGILQFFKGTTLVGSVSVTDSATAYNTSSDYRLKMNEAPLADALDLISALRPLTYEFIAQPGQRYMGFFAHELAEVVPQAVTGDKDAVDDEGKPIYQGVDFSKLVPLLTAAIQELGEKVTVLEEQLAALKAAADE